ncbi:hypothetical protein [Cohaesibacter gelatinilyticus]|uniref:Uncharacterized protein n=1 Tax=Cohaesibacter gelatinilyticus TaxID=372072 RepID=A0A285PI45_9HYPH|nr:hypothetical protein [Cohaesibacter gelatinilyticus]SNZ20943.1 hypothetical protein SAMN06265368_4057 [Cohaesibacter gelatinilyticus]
MGALFGGGKSKDNGAVALQKKTAAENQRRQLAAVAKQSAEIDQARAKSKGGGRKAQGNRLLTYIGSTSGQSTLG